MTDVTERIDSFLGEAREDPSRASITTLSMSGGAPLFPEFKVMGVSDRRLRLQTRFDSQANMSSEERRAYAETDVHTGDLWAHREVREALRNMMPAISSALRDHGLEVVGDPDLSQNPVRGNRLAMTFTVSVTLDGGDGALDEPGAPAEVERALRDNT